MASCGKIKEKFGKRKETVEKSGKIFDFILNYLLKNDKKQKKSLKIDKENFFFEIKKCNIYNCIKN